MGAGGTTGGIGRFILGIIMMIGGGYLLLDSIYVERFWMSQSMMKFGGVDITSGLLLIPMAIGIGVIFYNYKNPIGWLLFAGSLIALVFGVIASIQFTMAGMSLLDIILIIGLLVGGIGLFLSSLRGQG